MKALLTEYKKLDSVLEEEKCKLLEQNKDCDGSCDKCRKEKTKIKENK